MKIHLTLLLAVIASSVQAAPLPSPNGEPLPYQVSVQRPYATQRPLRSVAIAPFSCPRELVCSDVEQEFVRQLGARMGQVHDSVSVQGVMLLGNLPTLEDREARLIVGESLRADAFAFVRVVRAQTELAPPDAQDKWKQIKREIPVKRATLELRIVTREGAPVTLVSGAAELTESPKSLEAITAQLFEQMLEQAWAR